MAPMGPDQTRPEGREGLYPPESAACDELRLGAQGLGYELVVVGVLGAVPSPSAWEDQRPLRGWYEGSEGALRPPGIVFAHQMLLELLDDIVFLPTQKQTHGEWMEKCTPTSTHTHDTGDK